MQFPLRWLLLSVLLLLTSCRLIPVYKPDIQQGNIITQKQVNQLRPGMTPAQVLYIMGPPILKQNFILNRWDYVYTMKKPGKPMREKRLTIYFKNDHLVKMVGTKIPHGAIMRGVYPAPEQANPYHD